MQAFQRDLEKFRNLNTEVLGVSVDSVETHERFSREYGLEFPLISDEKGEIKNLYGHDRITYLIDRNGIIRHIQKGIPDNNVFLEKIKECSP